MNARLLWEDARRVARGARRLAGHLASREHTDLGLGAFSADGRTIAPGRLHHYAVRIASARPRPAAVTLRIDIAPMAPAPMDARHIFFARRIAVPPAGPTTVAVEYDWLDAAAFVVGEERLAPDQLRGGAPASGAARTFAVTATLEAADGAVLDSLTIYQAAAG